MDTQSKAIDRLHHLERHLSTEAVTNEHGSSRTEIVSMSKTDASLPPTIRDGYCIVLPEKLAPHTMPWTVRRNALSPERLVETFPAPDDDVRTLYDNLENALAKYPNYPYLGRRSIDAQGVAGKYEWITYAECGDARTAIGSGFVHLGIAPGSSIGIYSINCVEWMLVDAAAHAYSMVSVPIYDTLGPDTVQYITNHSELAAIACSLDVLSQVLEVLPGCPSVKAVIVFGTRPYQRLPDPPKGTTAKLIILDKVRALGYKYPSPHRPPGPADVALINYTSGTTGVPKGAVLTHGALIANTAGSSMLVHEHFTSGEQPSHISYLPLAHIYERFIITLVTHFGGAIGFYRGNVLELLEDVEELRPTTFASVPRLYNRIYDKVLAQVETGNPIAKKLFWTAYNSKRAAIESGDLSGGRFAPLWDRLVFSKIRAKLGGQVTLLTSGASPISDEVFTFLKICFGSVIEGYGMTETACLISMTLLDDPVAGHVGPPNPACEVKLDDIPEMGYTNNDKPNPRGEICVRGPILFSGYLKNEAATRETIDDDGWLHTGDVGMWLPGGRLKIIDRKKNIFKLAQGEYIAPEKIENVYCRSPLIMQTFVYGDSLKSNLVAIVVPDPEQLLPWAKERGLSGDLEALCSNKKVQAAILKSMLEEGRAAGLKGFEQVAAVRLVPEPLSVENGLMTPTFKIKRSQAQIPVTGWLEAFAAHPRIGDIESLKKKFGAFEDFSKGEQSAVAESASNDVIRQLAEWNAKYEAKFGHIFIVCAQGKSAQEMLEIIRLRYENAPGDELILAAAEQQKITELRLRALVEPKETMAERRTGQILAHVQGHILERDAHPESSNKGSPITTHVLDTCMGRPAPDVQVTLQRLAPGSNSAWETVARNRTNADGRIPNLLPNADDVEPGVYKISFDTEEYMEKCRQLHPQFFDKPNFYPYVSVQFYIAPEQRHQHFHVPLTWNPFGYSTYRGS